MVYHLHSIISTLHKANLSAGSGEARALMKLQEPVFLLGSQEECGVGSLEGDEAISYQASKL